MPKVKLICQNCGVIFERFPAFIRHAEKRGSTVKFCSRSCTDSARSKGIIQGKNRTGSHYNCEVCGSRFYRPASYARTPRFCSEPCRLKAYDLGLIYRTGSRPKRKLGEMISCIVCSAVVYRKKSMIVRNINKTCGNPACVSVYMRSRWGLSPREYTPIRSKRKARRTNFTARQRAELIGPCCLMCGTVVNLTLDHIVPVCAGGHSTKDNAQTLCGKCNNLKAKHVDRFLTQNQSPKGGFFG